MIIIIESVAMDAESSINSPGEELILLEKIFSNSEDAVRAADGIFGEGSVSIAHSYPKFPFGYNGAVNDTATALGTVHR